MKIADCRVVITGGCSGIGLQYARHLSSLGARVWSIDRDQSAIDAVRAEDPLDSRHTILAGDISDEETVAGLVCEIEQRAGGIDVLVNNAAVLRDQSLVSKLGRNIKRHSLADWNETIACNLTGTFLMSREVAAGMIRDRRSGLIVNVSSISARGNPGQTAYSATKAAIDALTVTWSQELALYRIRVAGIAPGFVETPMTRRIPPLFLESLKTRTPMKRYGTLAEFGHAIEFIIENDYFNGKVLELDGGLRF
jgi:3-oxoacyl-[acyl-carrier protein] reductase